MIVLLAIAIAFSTDRRKIRIRTVGLALAIQVLIGVLVLFVPWGERALSTASSAVQAVIDSSAEGIDFLFGEILPQEGSVFAFQVLPVIVFFASLTAVLYYLNVLQQVVRVVGGGLAKVLGTTRPESMNAAANIFVGQTEAPLVIRPYVKRLSRSELFAVMVGGLTTVAGSVLVGYSLLGARLDYLIAASFMAAPGALAMAKLLVPAGAMQEAAEAPAAGGTVPEEIAEETGEDSAVPEEVAGASALGGHRYRRRTAGTASSYSVDAPADTDQVTGPPAAGGDEADEDEPGEARNVIDAAARGASDGLKLALNVGAMLLAFISLIAL